MNLLSFEHAVTFAIPIKVIKGQEISEAIFLGFSLAPPWNGNYQNRAYLILRG